MPAILLYLLKVNIALTLFCTCYYTVLRQLTFYTINRVYLVTALVFSSIYPLINFTKVVENHQKLVQPLQIVIIDFNAKAARFTQPITQTNYWQWVVALFWVGVVVMTIRLLIQFWSLFKLYQHSRPATFNQCRVRIISDASNPFSFWQSIFINPEKHSNIEIASIIEHEQVHVKQWHTLDILLAELSLVFYWFNPGVWFMKKAISENLEFITDCKILQRGADAKSYQYSLLYTSINTSSNSIVNHFNISIIKKRIIMMNTKRSSVYKLTWYSFIAPAVLVLLLAFSTSKAALVKKSLTTIKHATERVMVMAGNSLPSLKDNAPQTGTDTTLKETKKVVVRDVKISADSSKNKTHVKMHFTGADSSYYVINGTPVSSQRITEINPNDIESISIVGRPSAGALFGSNAANGAVFIVTKDQKGTTVNKQLLQKISELKGKGTTEKTGIISIHPPIGSSNSVTIVGTGDSVNVKNGPVITSITTTGTTANVTDTTRGRLTEYSAINIPYRFQLKSSDRATDPLFIIDGKSATTDQLKHLDPQSIQNIMVLKNQSSIALYGDKGKYGVVIITTNAGKKK